MTQQTERKGTRPVLVTARWIAAGLVALFLAYVCGRAVGILLGIGPYATEVAAIVLVLAAGIRMATRRGWPSST
jgi:small neutral amino acid transporter SnatA (MarC family)